MRLVQGVWGVEGRREGGSAPHASQGSARSLAATQGALLFGWRYTFLLRPAIAQMPARHWPPQIRGKGIFHPVESPNGCFRSNGRQRPMLALQHGILLGDAILTLGPTRVRVWLLTKTPDYRPPPHSSSRDLSSESRVIACPWLSRQQPSCPLAGQTLARQQQVKGETSGALFFLYIHIV